MKHFVALLVGSVVSGFSVFASATPPRPWDRFEGCYDAVQVNGAGVLPAKFYKSRIWVGDAPFFTTVDGQKINSVNMSINELQRGADAMTAMESAFLDISGASYFDHGNGLSLLFQGDVKEVLFGNVYRTETLMTLARSEDGREVVATVDRNGVRASYVLRKTVRCFGE